MGVVDREPAAALLPVEARQIQECIDDGPFVAGVLRRQEAQTVYVGDAHQQIYEWRGAVNAMEQIKTANDSYLTMSFRFGETIAHAANKILGHLGETKALKGNPSKTSYLGTLEYDASLSRTNAMLVSELIRLLETGKRLCVVGGIADLERLLEGVMLLQNGKPSDVPELFGFGNWNEVRQAVQAEEGHELTTLVNLVERFSVGQLLAALRRAVSEESKAQVVLSTVHKAKGREWNRVYLTDDFVVQKKTPRDGVARPIPREELRIAYVAVTRAKVAVNIPPGIRNAFGISQDPKYDQIRSSKAVGQVTSPEPKASEANRPTSDTNMSGNHTSSSSSNKSGDGWLARIRDFFR
jgi:ATP-dependent exoDNAse (exonuclease V) beta subunit